MDVIWKWTGVTLMAVLSLLTLAHAEMSEEEKKDLFLKARQDIRPVPRQQETPRPKPKPAPTPRPTPRPTPQAKLESTPESTSDKPTRSSSSEEEDTIPLEREVSKPKGTPPPTPRPRKSRAKSMDAPITIEKSGLAEDEGYASPRKSSGGWFKRYRYLTAKVRRAIDNAPVRKGRWRYIIIHNSGTRQGNARIFNTYHKNVRKMQNGLAYHFVIGNGHGSGEGEIEIGSRWTKQINGGHVASDYLNNIALGICLVGDFNRDKPTPRQLAALEELTDYLRNRVGKYKGKPVAVRGHKQINPKPTDCPGDRFDLKWLRREFGY